MADLRVRLVLAFTLSAWLVGAEAGVASDLGAGEQPRLLLIAVEAIPYDMVRRLTDPGLGERAIFRQFRGPSAIINTFPSSSYITWSGLLQPFGIERSLGYEARYFDISTGRVRGGLDLKKVPAPWKDFFDWKLEGIFTKAVAYGFPGRYSLKELDEGLAGFLSTDQRIYSIYIVSTDGMGHLKGPAALEDFLREMDARLVAFAEAHPDEAFHTVIFSDHGMAGDEPLENVWPALRSAVKAAGFSIVEDGSLPGQVVVISYGLLTSFVAYAAPGQAYPLARIFTSVAGVDLCALPADDGWLLVSTRGEAIIRYESRDVLDLWSYEPRGGDPLDYMGVIDELRARAGDSDQRLFPDDWWFQSTSEHHYPDALYRLAGAFRLVRNPASIICSISPGYMFGARKTEWAAIPATGKMKWTHGALHRDASLGFLMTDLPGWQLPPALRYDEALNPIVGIRRSGGR